MKIQVGNITVEEDGSISIGQGTGDHKTQSVSITQSVPKQKPTKERMYIRKFNQNPRWSAKTHRLIGIGSLCVALVFLVFFGIMSSLVPLFFAGLFLLPLPGLVIIGQWFLRKSRFTSVPEVKSVSRIDQVRRETLRKLLENSNLPLGFKEIVEKLGWTEKTTILCISDLVTDGLVVEELDMDGEKWVYRWETTAALGQIERYNLPIQERAREMFEKRSQSVVEQTVKRRS